MHHINTGMGEHGIDVAKGKGHVERGGLLLRRRQGAIAEGHYLYIPQTTQSFNMCRTNKPAANNAYADHNVSPNPSMARTLARSLLPAAKSSNARSATGIMWRRINSQPSRAPASPCFRQHSHSSTAQPS